MRLRSFCVFIAAVLMALSALTSMLMKADEGKRESSQEASAELYEQTGTVFPVQGELIREYGAEFREEYRQWEMCEEVTFYSQGETVCSPITGNIEKIEGLADGGSCITISTGQMSVRLFPIYHIQVFEGSGVEQGTWLGKSADRLSMYAELDGQPIDPMEIGRMGF